MKNRANNIQTVLINHNLANNYGAFLEQERISEYSHFSFIYNDTNIDLYNTLGQSVVQVSVIVHSTTKPMLFFRKNRI